jgi:cytochrome c
MKSLLCISALLALALHPAMAATPTNVVATVDTCFRKVMLATNTADPMELAVTPDGRVIFIERPGTIKIWKPEARAVVVAGKLPVFYHHNGEKNVSWEDGLIGVTLDPGFSSNRWIYFYHSPTNTDASENRLSRFMLDGDRVALDTEKIVLRVPVERNVCCHSAGSLAFDGQGNLFISTGDNTNPFESDGFAPIDDRPGRRGFDAARTAGNTADLRGKILRIHPEPDGTYTIPQGNLFSSGTPKTRPEIFVMGDRNPFRISVDRASGTLYWGEVGPDAQGPKPERGPAGFDEVNRTRTAGNFGWPFVIADNKPYRRYDFAKKASGDLFSPASVVNDSANNIGLKDLPPAQPAWIWYAYSPSVRFPALSSGARTACTGPVYHFDEKLRSPHKLPREFDNTLFIYEWARNALFAVKLDAQGGMASMRRFLPQLTFKHPGEMELGPDGCLYLIEFGTNWEANKDSQIVRLEYEAPLAKAAP